MTLKVEIFIKRYILYIRLNGELDQNSVERLRIRVVELINKYTIKHLVLNCKQLQFMDSSGIGFIIGRFKNLQKVNGEVILCSMNESIRRIVRLSGLAKICKIKNDEDEVNTYLGVV